MIKDELLAVANSGSDLADLRRDIKHGLATLRCDHCKWWSKNKYAQVNSYYEHTCLCEASQCHGEYSSAEEFCSYWEAK